MIKKFNFNTYSLKNIEPYKKYITKNFNIYSVSTIDNPKSNTMIFCNNLTYELLQNLKTIKESIIIINNTTNLQVKNHSNNLFLKVDRPRKEYAKILKFILDNKNVPDNQYHFHQNGYYFGENVVIGENTIIEPFCFIESNVTIGNNCIIKSGTKICKYTTIGDNCVLKYSCLIGDSGFGIERDDDGTTYKIPHLGGVIICNNVEIGALTTIGCGTIEPTYIEDYVKIDNHVYVAHNCNIKKGTLITACCEISGSVKLGKNVWLGPNSSIINGISVGDNSVLGIGSVVIKSISKNSIVAGNPAEKTENLKKLKVTINKFLESTNNSI
ncbi:hexapeptide repeat of succinyl-transferase family protein [Clostridium sporogenes]|uniref:UDP-3-O-(3-hydroxymyristoyl)glucosamine N-acyltransferase n=1 Tax=Clostridium TaxID=1485 RepID=UPI000909B6F3|nr:MULTISPECIES: UDP-3-O-(3-hydroxymyristoyl)glucosamine N-acyltransferase [Clostridium]APF26446.1 hexapeptide repeat of succinyl-transferase family protein [Clostridium sporogenes]MDI6920866.1 UDP-3-O-(3-hydroxymyristoyl)glucosamine N-acyltransferase [Clostridium botulinum]WMU97388.1 UDP-3-O-(3-hydroxymyristoyl)glucosamine N-acyltransferase [Clostridium botulinum]